MSILRFFWPRERPSANTAKERLQLVLAHEGRSKLSPDYLPALQRELLQVISKYVDVDEDKVAVNVERGDNVSTLEVNIELPGRETATAKAQSQAN